jgi:hypothetical protein
MEDTCTNTSQQKLQQGWALKKPRKFARFSAKVKEFLDTVFHEGEEAGRKAIPVEVSHRMRYLRNIDGQKLFHPDEWLQPSQINSYFGRLSLHAKASEIKGEIENDDHLREILQAIDEEEERENRSAVMELN